MGMTSIGSYLISEDLCSLFFNLARRVKGVPQGKAQS